MSDMRHLEFIGKVAAADLGVIRRKESTYKGSWKKRGGSSVFHIFARCWDRLEGALREEWQWDIFAAIRRSPGGEDGTPLASLRDLRRYLTLVEAEMMAQGVVPEGDVELVADDSTVRTTMAATIAAEREADEAPLESAVLPFLRDLRKRIAPAEGHVLSSDRTEYLMALTDVIERCKRLEDEELAARTAAERTAWR